MNVTTHSFSLFISHKKQKNFMDEDTQSPLCLYDTNSTCMYVCMPIYIILYVCRLIYVIILMFHVCSGRFAVLSYTQLFANDFLNKCVSCFNGLPEYVVSSKTVAEFKRRLSEVDLSSF